MDNCIFCKIISGQIPAYKTYEDDKCVAFLDIHPVSPGHMLIITKSHYEWIQDVPDDLLTSSVLVSKSLINKIKEKLDADYIQVSVVGKDVPHFHIHLIPRMLKDGLEGWPTSTPTKSDLEAVINKLNN